MKRILIVDDEPQILKSLSRLFEDTDWDIRTALNAVEALSLLAEAPSDLVISDMRMPDMDGYQLLCRIKEMYPRVVRVILSGFTDEPIVFRAVQQNVAMIYVFKPWDNEGLIKIIGQIFDTEKLLMEHGLMELINNMESLPTIQPSYRRLLAAIDAECDIATMTKELERDPAISAKVLHVANSAYFGVRTASIRKAITFLGLANIRSLIVSTAVLDSAGITGQAAQQWFDAAVRTNLIMTMLHRDFLRQKVTDSENMAGILHDVGKTLMLKQFGTPYANLLQNGGLDVPDSLAVETARFGTNHAEVGGYLLQWWDLPYPIVEAALYHHTPLDERIINRKLMMALHIATQFAGNGALSEGDNPVLAACFEGLGVDGEALRLKILTMP